jgi:hypothetical protein
LHLAFEAGHAPFDAGHPDLDPGQLRVDLGHVALGLIGRISVRDDTRRSSRLIVRRPADFSAA